MPGELRAGGCIFISCNILWSNEILFPDSLQSPSLIYHPAPGQPSDYARLTSQPASSSSLASRRLSFTSRSVRALLISVVALTPATRHKDSRNSTQLSNLGRALVSLFIKTERCVSSPLYGGEMWAFLSINLSPTVYKPCVCLAVG